MTAIIFNPNAPNSNDAFAHIFSVPAAVTSYKIRFVRTTSTQVAGIANKPETRFSDPLDQKAWEVYKRIEPRYSEANRRLAK